MAFIIYTADDKGASPVRCGELLTEQSVAFSFYDVTLGVDHSEVSDLLSHLGMWAVDLVDREHESWTDSHLNEESDDQEIITFICENPEVIRTPIVVEKNDGKISRAILCEVPESIFSLFS